MNWLQIFHSFYFHNYTVIYQHIQTQACIDANFFVDDGHHQLGFDLPAALHNFIRQACFVNRFQ